MRTSLGDHLPALRRPAALAALAAAAGGAVVASAPWLGLWRLEARVQALDTVGTQPVTLLPGAETSPLTWAIAAVGVVAAVVALLVAVDRPPPAAEGLLVVSGTLVLLAATGLALTRPGPSAFADRPGAAELVAGTAPLPSGVGIELAITPGPGLWLLAAAGLLIALGALVALRRG